MDKLDKLDKFSEWKDQDFKDLWILYNQLTDAINEISEWLQEHPLPLENQSEALGKLRIAQRDLVFIMNVNELSYVKRYDNKGYIDWFFQRERRVRVFEQPI